MTLPPDPEYDAELDGAVDIRTIEITPDAAGGRLDRTLAEALADLSRGRIQALMAAGMVSRDGVPVRDAAGKAMAGD